MIIDGIESRKLPENYSNLLAMVSLIDDDDQIHKEWHWDPSLPFCEYCWLGGWDSWDHDPNDQLFHPGQGDA